MFTGIVEELGRVAAAETRGDLLAVTIEAGSLAKDLPLGGSIAVNGCCLTAVATGPGRFTCELTAETLARTAFDERLRPGAWVNLERPLAASGRFDGHIVQGHVDGVGRILRLDRTGESATLEVEVPPSLERYLVEKGSVAVDGISLTVAGLARGSFTVALIPYTLQRTNLEHAVPGGLVNIEVDLIAKYVERLLSGQGR